MRRLTEHSRLWRWSAVVVAGGVLSYAIVLALNWPFTKQALIDVLQERSLRQVTIEHFRSTSFPPGCVAEGIRFLHIKHKGKTPLLTITKLVIEDNYSNLLTFQHRLTTVRVIGLHVAVPPVGPSGGPSPIMPLTYAKSRVSMVIGTMFADGAVLDMLSSTPGKPALRIVVNKFSLQNIGSDTPVNYNVVLRNSEPPGTIRSAGTWGPWNPKQPGTTPVHGRYVYENANLGTFAAISGTLNSKGRFSGTLSHIVVHGTADVADFKVKDTSHKRLLNTQFRVVVDGTDGDVYLNQLTAEFDRTVLVFKGSISGESSPNGKAISLDMFSKRARIEDLLDLFISANLAPMTGDITLDGHIAVPAGSSPFLDRLKVEGGFGAEGSKFTNRQTERELARLSVRAVKGDKDEDKENPQTVLSNLTGEVNAENGTAHLSQISFSVPGAHATLNGTFGLIDHRADFRGVLMTTGEVSDATTGFKSFLVKVISPFFKKKQHVKTVPFKITGPYGHTNVSLNLGSKKK